MKLVAIVGSAVSSGKTRAAVEHAIAAAVDLEPELDVGIVDLAQDHVSILDGRHTDEYQDDTAQIIETITSGTAFLISSPIYRGTYTGALKNLLDHVPLEGLASKAVGLIATGAISHHYLAIDHQFRGLLAWFNAYVLPGSVYLDSASYVGGKIVDESSLSDLADLGRSLVTVSGQLTGIPARPPCLTQQMMDRYRG